MDQPSLDDAYAAIDRAHQSIGALRVKVNKVRKGHVHDVFGETDPETGAYVARVVPHDIPKDAADDIRLSAGEILTCNLRPALDYLVYALAWLDSRNPQKGTQFPICNSAKQFNQKRRSWLKGVSNSHVAALRRLQPYKGRKVLATLRDLSNAAKHRHLTIIDHHLQGGFEVVEQSGSTRGIGDFPYPSQKQLDAEARLRELFDARRAIDEPPKRQAKPPASTITIPDGHPLKNSDVHVHLGLTFIVTLGDGPALVPALDSVETGIREILHQFEPDFER